MTIAPTVGRRVEDRAFTSVVPRRRPLRDALSGVSSGPALLFSAMCLNNLAVFGFQMLVSRELGPTNYGALGSVLSLAWLFGVTSGAVAVAVTRQVAASGGTTRWDLRRPNTVLFAVASAVCLAGVALSAEAAGFLHLRSTLPMLLLVLDAYALLLQVIARGVILGSHRYRTIAGCVLATAVARLALGAALTPYVGVTGAVGAYTAADVLATVILLLRTRQSPSGESPTRLRLPFRAVGLSVTAYGGIWTFSALDTLMARHLLPSHESGLYVAASVAGSIAIWIPFNVTSSLFPRLSRDAALGGTGAFWLGLAVTSSIAIASELVLSLGSPLVVGTLFGSGYSAAAPLLTLLAISNSLQGVACYLVHHHLAGQRRTSTLPWVAVVLLAALVEVNHRSPNAIAIDAIVASASLTASLLILSLQRVTATVQ